MNALVSSLAKGSKIAFDQVKLFVKITLASLVVLAVLIFVGIIFKIELLIILPTVIVALICLPLFMVMRFASKYIKILSGLTQLTGTLAVWLLFFGFLNAIHPEWFYLSGGNFKNLLVFGTAALFIAAFVVYSGIRFGFVNFIIAAVVIAMTALYGIKIVRPGIYDQWFSKRQYIDATIACVSESTPAYKLNGVRLEKMADLNLTTNSLVAILDELPRQFGGELFLNCMLPNSDGNYVNGQEVWLPKRKLFLKGDSLKKELEKDSIATVLIPTPIRTPTITPIATPIPIQPPGNLEWYLDDDNATHVLNKIIKINEITGASFGLHGHRVYLKSIFFTKPFILVLESYENTGEKDVRVTKSRTILIDRNGIGHSSKKSIFFPSLSKYRPEYLLFSLCPGEKQYIVRVFDYYPPETFSPGFYLWEETKIPLP
ncbi:MAG: hypothetical protein WC610_00025 [Patescibacteria group bacterium]